MNEGSNTSSKPFNFPEDMPLYQRRVIIEKFDLDEKIEKLASFRNGEKFLAISDLSEQRRLVDQLQTMREYSHILAERILHFPK